MENISRRPSAIYKSIATSVNPKSTEQNIQKAPSTLKNISEIAQKSDAIQTSRRLFIVGGLSTLAAACTNQRAEIPSATPTVSPENPIPDSIKLLTLTATAVSKEYKYDTYSDEEIPNFSKEEAKKLGESTYILRVTQNGERYQGTTWLARNKNNSYYWITAGHMFSESEAVTQISFQKGNGDPYVDITANNRAKLTYAVSDDRDLAIIKVQKSTDIPVKPWKKNVFREIKPLQTIDNYQLKPGQPVILVGYSGPFISYWSEKYKLPPHDDRVFSSITQMDEGVIDKTIQYELDKNDFFTNDIITAGGSSGSSLSIKDDSGKIVTIGVHIILRTKDSPTIGTLLDIENLIKKVDREGKTLTHSE